jgi:hypothetical protein
MDVSVSTQATTGLLLLIAVVGAIAFVSVLLVEGARRPGYDPRYHTGSELELGRRGWIQRANFVLMGLAAVAFAAGVHSTLDSTIGAGLLVVFGAGLLISGAFAPDPVRGYPPGAPIDRRADPTWRAQVHEVSGPVAFLALFGACLTLVGRLEGGWRLYTMVTAAAGLAMTGWTAVAYKRDAANTGLVQRGLIGVYWSWIVGLSLHLVTVLPSR